MTKQPDRIQIHSDTVKLPCELTEEEWEQRAEKTAEVFATLTEMKEQEKARAKEARAEIKDLEAEHAELAEQVHTRTEKRDVVVIDYGIVESNEVVTIRRDTGEQIGGARAMEAHEREKALQGQLPLEAGE